MSRKRIFSILLISILTLGTLAYTTSQASSLAALLSQPASPWQNEICYALADNEDGLEGDVLVQAAYETGEVTFIGETGTFFGEAMTFDLSTETLYAADAGQLGTLNTTTGDFTATSQPFGTGDGSLGAIQFSDADGLSFHPATGELYAVHRVRIQNDLLFKVDPVTGAHVENAFAPNVDYLVLDAANISFQDVDDLAFDPTTNVLYAIANSRGAGDHLVTVNITTGVLTIVGQINVDDMEGLTFDTTGQLLGTTGKASGTNSNKLYRIDKTTGNADIANAKSLTIQDNPPYPYDYEAVDCLSSPAEPTPTPTQPPDFVDLLYFRVDRVDGTQVTLSWATAAEVNTYGFNLYRGAGDNFDNATLVHFEPARGGRVMTTYEVTDTTPNAGVWWYFLEEVSTQGGNQGDTAVIGRVATFRNIFLPFLSRSQP